MMRRLARERTAEADQDGTALPSPERALLDRVSAQVVVEKRPLAAEVLLAQNRPPWRAPPFTR